MVEILDSHGRVVHRSRNLRGVLDHARRAGLESARAYPIEADRAALSVAFSDGTFCHVQFASFQVLCRWLMGRRSWAGFRRINGSTPF